MSAGLQPHESHFACVYLYFFLDLNNRKQEMANKMHEYTYRVCCSGPSPAQECVSERAAPLQCAGWVWQAGGFSHVGPTGLSAPGQHQSTADIPPLLHDNHSLTEKEENWHLQPTNEVVQMCQSYGTGQEDHC